MRNRKHRLAAIAVFSFLASLTSGMCNSVSAAGIESPSVTELFRPELKLNTASLPKSRGSEPDIEMVRQAISKASTGDLKGAVVVLDDTIKKYPSSYVAYAYRGGYKYSLGGDDQGALDDENKAISLAPTYGFAYKYRAMIYDWGFKKYDAAVEDGNKACAYYPEDSDSWYVRGHAKYMLARDVEALPDLCVSNVLWKDSAYAHYYAGVSMVNLGIYAPALPDAQSGVKLAPKNGDMHWLLGYVYEKSGKKNEALDEYNSALNCYTASHQTSNLDFIAKAIARVKAS